ncbi:MAG: hypothetical protein IKE57_04215 [Oscillospiraceae bacterium]|nr:hypothetical protein [Oscillospiraceae bacterium]
MFHVGDLIVYGSTGVCLVSEIAHRNGADGGERLFYVLKPLYQKCTISAPVDSDKVFMRPIISRSEADRLIDSIPHRSAEACQDRALRQLTKYYEDKIRSHDCGELIDLTMSIHAKRELAVSQNRKLGSVDERFMKRAEELLFGEFAAALEIEPDDVPDYIRSRIENMPANSSNS